MADTGFGLFMSQIGGKPLLTATEELDLARRAKEGDQHARDVLIERNVPLVLNIVQRYARMGFDLEDLVQEGLIGMTKAVDRFDPEKGFKLSTYATWWIRQSVFRWMNGHGGSTIRVPGKIRETRRKIEKLATLKGITIEDAAIELEVDPEEVVEAFAGPRTTVSLDSELGEDHSDRYESIPDPQATDPAERWELSGPDLQAALDKLSPEQRAIIEARYGLTGDYTTRDDVAKLLDVRGKDVQKQQAEGLEILRRELVLQNVEEGEELEAVLEDYERQVSERDPVRCDRRV